MKYDPGETYKTDLCKSGQKLLTIPPSGYSAQATGRILADYETAGYRLAGRSKGVESIIYAPPANGVVGPDELIVYWRNRPPIPKMTVQVLTNKNAELFHLDDVDGSTGSLDSAALRKALEGICDDPARNHDLRLNIRAPMRPADSVEFAVLTHAEEDALKHGLLPGSTHLRIVDVYRTRQRLRIRSHVRSGCV